MDDVLFSKEALIHFKAQWLNQAWAIWIAQVLVDEYTKDAECCGSDCNLDDFRVRLNHNYEKAPYDEYSPGGFDPLEAIEYPRDFDETNTTNTPSKD